MPSPVPRTSRPSCERPRASCERAGFQKTVSQISKTYMLKKNKEGGPETYLTTSGTLQGFREFDS